MSASHAGPVLSTPPITTQTPPAATEPGGPEVAHLREQITNGNLAGLRQYLASTRQSCDWQDRIFMIGLLAPAIPHDVIATACAIEPDAADLALVRCAWYADLALQHRGTAPSNEVPHTALQKSAEAVCIAMEALEKAAELDPDDPTAFACILRALGIFDQLKPAIERAFQQATTLAPNLVHAYRTMTTLSAQRWGGSHENSLQFARFAMNHATRCSDMAVCLFWAHLLIATDAFFTNKDSEASRRYFQRPDALRELAMAFDLWTAAPYAPSRSSIPYLHYAACWFFFAADRPRLRTALALSDGAFYDVPWSLFGDPKRTYDFAVLFASGQVTATDPTSRPN